MKRASAKRCNVLGRLHRAALGRRARGKGRLSLGSLDAYARRHLRVVLERSVSRLLKRREFEIALPWFRCVCREAIAQELGISVRTVEIYVASLYTALEVHSRAAFIIRVTELLWKHREQSYVVLRRRLPTQHYGYPRRTPRDRVRKPKQNPAPPPGRASEEE